MTAAEAKVLSDNALSHSDIMHWVHLAIMARAKRGFRFINLQTIYNMDECSVGLKFLVGANLEKMGYKITGHPDDGIWYANWD